MATSSSAPNIWRNGRIVARIHRDGGYYVDNSGKRYLPNFDTDSEDPQGKQRIGTQEGSRPIPVSNAGGTFVTPTVDAHLPEVEDMSHSGRRLREIQRRDAAAAAAPLGQNRAPAYYEAPMEGRGETPSEPYDGTKIDPGTPWWDAALNSREMYMSNADWMPLPTADYAQTYGQGINSKGRQVGPSNPEYARDPWGYAPVVLGPKSTLAQKEIAARQAANPQGRPQAPVPPMTQAAPPQAGAVSRQAANVQQAPVQSRPVVQQSTQAAPASQMQAPSDPSQFYRRLGGK